VKNDSHRLPTKLWMNRPLPRAGEVPTRSRNRRRAAHHQAVVNDLCDIVADLFIAESKVVETRMACLTIRQVSIDVTVKAFITLFALPTRALGVTPSEVLLHMRLMACT
jgi:hypothetical protein